MVQECTALEFKNQSLERRVQAVAKDLAQAMSSKAELEETLRRTNGELACLQESGIAKEEETKLHIEKSGKETSQSELKLKGQLTLLNAMLVEEQEKTKKIERQCMETQEYARKQISDLAGDLKQEDDSKEKLLVTQDHISKLENTITDLQCEMKRDLNNHQAEVRRLQHACELCHKDLNLVLFEKKETEKDAEEMKALASQYQKLLEDSERSVRNLENGHQALRDEEKMKLSEKIEDLHNENEALRGGIRRALGDVSLLKDQGEKAVGRVKDELEKEKRRCDLYKSKALKAHLRSSKAKEVLDLLCK
jgi:chromosome segregation ATPase